MVCLQLCTGLSTERVDIDLPPKFNHAVAASPQPGGGNRGTTRGSAPGPQRRCQASSAGQRRCSRSYCYLRACITVTARAANAATAEAIAAHPASLPIRICRSAASRVASA